MTGAREQRKVNRDRERSPWYCPNCGCWVGWKLDECPRGGFARPRRPVRYDDVPFDDSRRVGLTHRIKAKLGWYS